MYPVIFIIKKIHSNVYLKIKRELFCILLVRVVTCIIATFHTSVLTLFIRQVKYCSVFILPLKYMSHVPTFPKYPYKSSLLKTISLIKFIATTSRKDSFTRMMVTNFFRFLGNLVWSCDANAPLFWKSLYLLLDIFRAKCETTSIKEIEASAQHIHGSNKWRVSLISENWK